MAKIIEGKLMTEIKLLKKFEVAKILNVSMPTLLKIIRNGELKVVKVGDMERISSEEVNKYLKKDK